MKLLEKENYNIVLYISKFTAPGPFGHYTFLYRVNTFGVKNRLLFKKWRM